MSNSFFKYIGVFCLVSLLIVSSTAFSFAYSGSTSVGLSQNNSTVQNLISYASNYDGFYNADYVVFQDEQYSYYIVWGDLTVANDIVSGVNVDSIHYYRSGSVGDYEYNYIHSVESTFQLFVNDSVVTSIKGLGGSSSLYSQLKFYHYGLYLIIFAVGFLFANLLIHRR